MVEKKIDNTNDLFAGLIEPTAGSSIQFQRLCVDSRQVQAGDLFIAEGAAQQYIEQAIAQGAAAIVTDHDASNIDKPVFVLPNLNAQLPLIFRRYLNFEPDELSLTAFTGTNGKTSCCHYLAQLLRLNGHSVGVMGTTGHGVYPQLSEPTLTTPDLWTVYQLLADFYHQGIKDVCLEASSHGLAQRRLAGLQIKTGVLTNLTHDHLDYHGSFAAYREAKHQLFKQPLHQAVINLDDAWGRELIEQHQQDYPIIAYSLEQQTNDALSILSAYNIETTAQGMRASVASPWGIGQLQLPLLGAFSLSNCLAAIACLASEIDFHVLLEQATQLTGVPGRMQRVPDPSRHIVIDFAHTPDALRVALATLRLHCKGRLICVMGCGGDRDKQKRPIMGQLAEQLADQVIITDDNPRYEDNQAIIRDILTGLVNPKDASVIPQRDEAIAKAVQMAGVDDGILIAGKGHENYQDCQGQKIFFSDYECAKHMVATTGVRTC